MKSANILFFVFSTITFIYAIRTALLMYMDRNKIAEAEGEIVEIDYVLPQNMQLNTKLATFEYEVGGRRYTSKNSLKLPLNAEIGDTRDIKYYVDSPNILYTRTGLHFHIAMIASILCLVLGLLKY